jgi:nicotinate-nucleotide adenylyltransferase
MAEGCHRLKMCQLVSQNDAFFEVEDIELTRDGPSYTVDTALALKARGWAEVAWLIGADMVPFLPTWHRPAQLLQEVHFVIAQRPGHVIDWLALPPAYQSLRARVVTTPLLEISASDIRQRVRAGKSIRYLVPPEVERYVSEQRLYVA